MKKESKLVVILLLLLPIPFFSNNCLTAFSTKFMNDISEQNIKYFTIGISTFRKRQLESAILTLSLFCISLVIAYLFSSLNFSHISWMTIASTMLLTHSVFGLLGWEIQTWAGGSVIEVINTWWFRILYSIGVILLFLTIIR
jgi:hypothetical protein